VLRTSSVEGRFEAMHAGGMTELVGREEELELLLRRVSIVFGESLCGPLPIRGCLALHW
jgi:hypothetical protein